jgi:hypothetical protein
MMAPTPGPGAAVAARAFSHVPVLCADCGAPMVQLPCALIVLRVLARGRVQPPPQYPNSIIARCHRRGRGCGVFNEIVLVLPSAA